MAALLAHGRPEAAAVRAAAAGRGVKSRISPVRKAIAAAGKVDRKQLREGLPLLIGAVALALGDVARAKDLDNESRVLAALTALCMGTTRLREAGIRDGVAPEGDVLDQYARDLEALR